MKKRVRSPYLSARGVKCQTAIVAIGTNDAWYTISDEQFIQNLGQVIEHLRAQGTQQIILLPAFYSTLAARKNPALAGSIDRVEQINQLLNQVAVAQQVAVPADALQPLFGNYSAARRWEMGVPMNN